MRRRCRFKTCNKCAVRSFHFRYSRRPDGNGRTLAKRMCRRARALGKGADVGPLMSLLDSQAFRCCHCLRSMRCSGPSRFMLASKTLYQHQSQQGQEAVEDLAICCAKCLMLREDDYSFDEFTGLRRQA